MIRKLVELLSFVVGPLFINGRWLLWFFGALCLMMFGDAIEAAGMEIPTRDQVIKIKGVFQDTSRGYAGKSGGRGIKIRDTNGVVYGCSCAPLGNSNCLGRRWRDHAEVVDQLDSNLVEKYGLNKAMLRWLAAKPGEVWLYPRDGLFGSRNSCYKIADEVRVYRSFDQAVREYEEVKNGLDVYFIWFMKVFGSVLGVLFFTARILMYISRNLNGHAKV